MKALCISLLLSLAGQLLMHLNAQDPPKKSAVVKTSENINKSTQKLNEQSMLVAQEAGQASANIQTAIQNAKMALKVFEPIIKLRLRKAPQQDAALVGTNDLWATPPLYPVTDTSTQAYQYQYNYEQYQVNPSDLGGSAPIVTQSPTYNTDGTANLGNQNSKKYGCYLNVLNGAIMDEIDAAGNSKSIDLIFTSTDYFNENVPMYAFLTPAFAKNDKFAYNFFKGTKYKDQNIPPKLWEEVNESEVAMTNLTGEQFERIQTNQQLTAVVKQITGFSQKIESRTKLDNKVIAVKTEMGDRTAYGLLYIVSHTGTFGENSYLKVKIKVTGLDATGDGNPDPGLYNNY